MILLRSLQKYSRLNKYLTTNKIYLQHLKQIQCPIRYSFTSNQTKQSIIENILKEPSNYDSNKILEEYKSYAEEIDNYDKVMEVSNRLLKQMRSRNDDLNSLQICLIAINLCAKKYKKKSENPHIYFQGQQVLLTYKLGKKDEANQLAEDMYKQFSSASNQFDVQYLIKSAKYLLEVVTQIKSLNVAKQLLSDMSDLLAQDNWQSLSPQQIYEIYYLNFGVLFQDENYEEAAMYGWKAYQQLISQPNSMFRAEYILTGIYLCYKQLKQKDKCDEIILEIQKFQQIDPLFFDQLTIEYFQPFTLEGKEERQKKFRSVNKQEQSSSGDKKKDNSKLDWDIENDKGNQYMKDKAFKEGIAYYKDILSQLDSKEDALKYIFVQDRMAYMHAECQEYTKAEELCLSSHQMLLQMYNNQLIRNQQTFQNLSYLKSIYERKGDLEKSIEWGDKWHNYCVKYKLFEIESEALESNMLTHVDVLIKAGKKKEVLQYNNFIISYLKRFNKDKEMFKYGFYQLLYTFSDKYHNLVAQKEAAISICEISLALKDKHPEYKQHYFNMLKESAILTIQTEDFTNFMKYGQEYLNVRSEFESEEESIDTVLDVMFNLGQQFCIQNDIKTAEEILLKAIDISQRRSIDAQYIQMHLLLSIVYIKANQLEDADKYYNQAKQLKHNHFDSDLILEKEIMEISGILLYHQGDYNKSLDNIEYYLEKHHQIGKQEISEDLNIILQNLLESNEHTQRVKEIITKYQIQLKN